MHGTLKIPVMASAWWLSWLGHWIIHQKVVGSIPGQGKYLGCRINLWLKVHMEGNACFSFALMFLFLSKINKNISFGED